MRDKDGFKYTLFNGQRHQFMIPQLGTEGLHFQPYPASIAIPRHMPVLRTINHIWDLANFAIPRGPWMVEKFAFARPHAPSVVDLPIKFPGTLYRLPGEYAGLAPLLQRIASIESRVNPRVDDYFAYLTVDLRDVTGGKTQRHGGAHVDGFQGARIQPKVRIDHSYTISDCLPTLFHDQSFDLTGLDERFDDFSVTFDQQIDPGLVRIFEPYSLLFMDAYAVHSAAVAPVDTKRCFVRLSYSVREFDRLGNGHNPMFDYNWEMVDRNFRAEQRLNQPQ